MKNVFVKCFLLSFQLSLSLTRTFNPPFLSNNSIFLQSFPSFFRCSIFLILINLLLIFNQLDLFPFPDSAAKDLINHLLVVNKEKRYTAGQVLKHPWVTSEGATGKQINLQREVSMNLEKNFKDRRSAKRKPIAPKN